MSAPYSIPPESGHSTDLNRQMVQYEPEDEDSMDLLPIVNLLLRNLGYIFKSTTFLVLIILIGSLFIPPTYTATAQFLPSNRLGAGPSSPLRGSDEFVSSLASIPEYYKTLLESDTFLRNTVKRLAADEKVDSDSQQEYIETLVSKIRGNLSVTFSKSTGSAYSAVTILSLNVDTSHPDLSVKANNALLDELSAFSNGERNQRAIQNRDFIQQQLNKAEAELRNYENELATFALRNRKIETPDLQVEKDRLERAVKAQEEVFLALRKEFEMAKIKVQEEASILQILERPTLAIKTGPKRTRLLILAAVIGLLLFSVLAYARDRWARMDRNDKEVQELLYHLGNIKSEIEGYARKARTMADRVFSVPLTRLKTLLKAP